MLEWLANNMDYIVKILAGLTTISVPLFAAFRWIREQGKKLNTIYLQLTPNGGKSLSDRITQINRELRVQQTRYYVLSDSDPHSAMFECSPLGSWTYVSDHVAKLFGTEKAELIGRNWLRKIENEFERNHVWDSWKRAIEQDIPYKDVITIQRDKETVSLEIETFPCRDVDNSVLLYVGTIKKV